MQRREFLKKSGATVAAATILPRKVFGKMGGNNNFIAPSDQLTRGIIGLGVIGRSDCHFESDQNCRLVSLCDVDANHLSSAVEAAKASFGENVKAYTDWRDLVHDPNVDIVHIATPPHWHGLMALEASNAHKDILCEKPMTRTIGEGKRVQEAVKRNGNIFRLDTWFRFKDTFYGLGTTVKPLKKLVSNGLLGWPLTVRISASTGFAWKFYWVGRTNLVPEPVPACLDYDMWLGPAPKKPYHPHRVHQTFRGYWDYDGGGLADMGQHYIDPVQYILGKDDTFPVKVEVDAPLQHPDAVGTWRSITYTYEDGCKIILEGEGYETNGKVPYIEGPLGKVYQGFECTIPNVWNKLNELPDPPIRNTDFLECVRKRRNFALDEKIGYHSSTIVNMGVVALRLGRTLYFDPATEMFVGDDAANLLLNPPMFNGWSMD